MKKTSLILAVLLIALSFALPVFAKETGYPPDTKEDITAEAIYLINLDTGTVIYEKNSDDARAPASLTKILTAILALEHTDNLNTEMVTYPQYVQDYLYTYRMEHGEISTGDLRAGDTLSMNDYLYALLLPSANEAALTIADHIGGSQEGFRDMLNARAKELGATNTHFVNPNGLPEDDHYSSARDLALFAQHAMSLPGFMDIVTTNQYTASPANRPDVSLTWNSTILMQDKENINYYYEPIRGIKTGTLTSSGRCFVSTASKNGFNYLLVLLGSPFETGGPQTAFQDARIIYNWVFSSFSNRTLTEVGTPAGELPVRLSDDADYVELVAAEHFSTLLPNNVEDSSVTRIVETTAEFLDAPIAAGTPVGTLVLLLDGVELGRVPLLTGKSIEASPLLVFWEKLKATTETLWFKFLVIFLLLLIVFYSIVMIVRNKNRKRRRHSGGRSGRPRR